jgi:hypothetical protein
MIILSSVLQGANATTIVVAPDGSGDAPDIQSAIDGASTGDTVLLEDGVFRGEGNRNVDLRGLLITVRSSSGLAESCVLDCEGSGRAFVLASGEPPGTKIAGLTIRNGLSFDFGVPGDGGAAVLVSDGSTVLLESVRFEGCVAVGTGFGENVRGGAVLARGGSASVHGCHFVDNRSSGAGGAVWASEGGQAVVDGGVIEGNRGSDGGGAGADAGASIVLTGTLLRANTALGTKRAGRGGALFGRGTLTATDLVIEDNVARGVDLGPGGAGEGGGLWWQGEALVTDCAVVSNLAEGGGFESGVGGGVYSEGSITLVGCHVAGNVSEDGIKGGVARGGGAFLASSAPEVTVMQCLVTGNQAGVGGGIYLYGGMPSIRETTIASNVALNEGGGVLVSGADARLLRSIVSWNCAPVGRSVLVLAGATATFDCCAIDLVGLDGGGAWDFVDEVVVGDDPSFCEPLFCSSIPGDDGDYSLRAGSPCAPAQSPCGAVIGARGVACGATPTRSTSWSELKATFGRSR